MSEAVTLVGILKEHGLDESFWLEKFKSVGITDYKQLQYADEDTLNQLERYKRHKWEGNALRACFPSLTKPSKEENQERIDKMDQSMKDLLEKLGKITDERDRMERMKIDFKIPSGEKDLQNELTQMKFLKNDLADRKDIPPSEIIKKMSAGRVMRGYYIQEDVWDRVLPRRILIDIPGKVEFWGPRMKEVYTSMDFFSEKKSGLYVHVVDHWGFNSALSGGVIGLFTADIGSSMQKTSDETDSIVSEGGFTEIKETVFVPTASFCLEDVPHYISPDALKALEKLEGNHQEDSGSCILKKLEQDVKDLEDAVNESKLCQEFFQEFGSHYFAGTYHFGGYYTRSVTCRNKRDMSRSECIKLSKWGLQTGVSGIFEEFTFGVQVGFDKSHDESTSQFKENEDYKVEKRLLKYGGPEEADFIPQWKYGLAKYPSTWAVIGQDVQKDEWKGVWELLGDEYASKFSNIKKIRSTLKHEWEKGFKEKLEANKQLIKSHKSHADQDT
jgi:hypothetical protein